MTVKSLNCSPCLLNQPACIPSPVLLVSTSFLTFTRSQRQSIMLLFVCLCCLSVGKISHEPLDGSWFPSTGHGVNLWQLVHLTQTQPYMFWDKNLVWKKPRVIQAPVAHRFNSTSYIFSLKLQYAFPYFVKEAEACFPWQLSSIKPPLSLLYDSIPSDDYTAWSICSFLFGSTG